MFTGTFRYAALKRVPFGRPAAEAVRDEVELAGDRRVLVVSNRSLMREGKIVAGIVAALGERHAGTFGVVPAHSPRGSVIAIAEAARASNADLLLAVGGGSVIDACKAAQLALWRGARTTDELAALRSKVWIDASISTEPHDQRPRMVAVPTTLSAAEFTWYAGVTDETRGVKETYTNARVIPRAIILDPAVLLATPLDLFLASGIKALDHAVERITSRQANPLSDAPALQAIRLIARGLPKAKADPADLAARQDCQLGAWLSVQGVLAGVGTGLSHAIGHVLGAHAHVPHGETSCVTLPAVLDWSAEEPGHRQALVSEAFGAPGQPAGALIRNLVASLGLPTRLGDVGVDRSQFPAIALKVLDDRATPNSARPVRSASDVEAVLERAA
ncbi:MAG: iron-containing alcohol dehydrogenase [Hyphomicrobiaceae bacterium]